LHILLQKKDTCKMKNLKTKLRKIEKTIHNPKIGLPDEIFYFVGRLTPYINVDLLIKCPIRGTLMTWRNDKYSGKGWHLPGGIIRFKEKINKRIKEVGKTELNITISKIKGPLAVNEIIINQKERSHFISLLYQCFLSKSELKKLLLESQKNSKISFFKRKPYNLLKWHKIYKKYLYC